MYKRLSFLDDFDLQKKYLPPSDPEVRIAEDTLRFPLKIDTDEQNWTQQVQPVSKIRFETNHFTSHHMFIAFIDMT